MASMSNLNTNPASRERHKGRKVFDWTFNAPDGGKPVEVFLVHGDTRDAGMKFRADCPALNESVEAVDINDLKEKLETVLSDKSLVMLGVQWEDWLCVEVKGAMNPRSGGISVTYSHIKRGIHPVSGKAVTIDSRNRFSPFPEACSTREKFDYMSNSGPIDSSIYLGDPKEVSYIQATPENIAALEEITRRIRQLRMDLADVLSQELIRAKLPQVVSGQFLIGNVK